jgi:hypothetical protein
MQQADNGHPHHSMIAIQSVAVMLYVFVLSRNSPANRFTVLGSRSKDHAGP